MSCDRVRRQLTSYLDGELEGSDGSVVRGHLRECAACREVAGEEAMLRDQLRQLPTLDPPPSLWAGVQAQLAAAEVADAKRPAWRRALARWAPVAPRFAAGTLVAAAAVGVLWWRSHRGSADEVPTAPSRDLAVVPAPAPAPAPSPPPPANDLAAGCAPGAASAAGGEITADLAGEAARVTASYCDAAEDLLVLAGEARLQWTDEQRAAFDTKVTELRGQIDRAIAGRPRQRAWRELITYLQRAVVRDDVALAGGGQ